MVAGLSTIYATMSNVRDWPVTALCDMESTTHAVGNRAADCLSWSSDRGGLGLRVASLSKKFHGSRGEEHSKDDKRERRTNNHR